MTKETKIEKLVLNIRGKKIELNIEEAKELKSALSEIFGADNVQHVHHYEYPQVYPWRPYYGTLWCGQSQQLGNAQQGVYEMCLTEGNPSELTNANT